MDLQLQNYGGRWRSTCPFYLGSPRKVLEYASLVTLSVSFTLFLPQPILIYCRTRPRGLGRIQVEKSGRWQTSKTVQKPFLLVLLCYFHYTNRIIIGLIMRLAGNLRGKLLVWITLCRSHDGYAYIIRGQYIDDPQGLLWFRREGCIYRSLVFYSQAFLRLFFNYWCWRKS